MIARFAAWWRGEPIWRRRALWFPVAVLLAFNLAMAANNLLAMVRGSDPIDWFAYWQASIRVHEGGLYDDSDIGFYHYRYSPVLAYGTGFLGFIGIWGWRALHVLAALAMPSWGLRFAVLLSWPFWFDVSAGNVMVFVALAGVWSLRGSRLATAAFLVLALLIPRPLMMPLVAWVLWQRPEWRIPFGVLFIAHAVGVLLSGWGPEWVARLLSAGPEELGSEFNYAPSRIIGNLWLLVALPGALLLTLRGWIGAASVLAAPYWLPYYWLMLALDWDRLVAAVRRLPRRERAAEAPA
ncbi:MAG: hypothetical protein K5924_12425 [Chloroflexi bacterium]|nr:hypothetical protein [Chloroflexota bacterium]